MKRKRTRILVLLAVLAPVFVGGVFLFGNTTNAGDSGNHIYNLDTNLSVPGNPATPGLVTLTATVGNTTFGNTYSYFFNPDCGGGSIDIQGPPGGRQVTCSTGGAFQGVGPTGGSASFTFTYVVGQYLPRVWVEENGPALNNGSDIILLDVEDPPPIPEDVFTVTAPNGETSVTVGETHAYTSTFTWSPASFPSVATYNFLLTDASTGVLVQTLIPSTSFSFPGEPPTAQGVNITFNTAGTYKVCAGGEDTSPVTNDKYGATTCSGVITVDPPPVVNPPTVDLKAQGLDGPLTINHGQSITLGWTTTNSPTLCDATIDWSGTKTVLGGSEVRSNITSNSLYRLTCSNSGGSDQDEVQIFVAEGSNGGGGGGGGADPKCSDNIDNDGDGLIDENDPGCQGPSPTVTFTASPTSVSSGGSSTLSWTVANAVSCSASGNWAGNKSINGGSEVQSNITSDRNYTLTCINTFGSTNGFASVTVVAPPPGGGAPTVTLTANPTSISSGGSSTLTWTVSGGADECIASGGWSGNKGVAGGNEAVGPLSVTTGYTLTCTNASGSTADSASVSVAGSGPPPVVTLTASPTSVNFGGSSTLTWAIQSEKFVDVCVASGGWSGNKNVKNGSESVGPISANTTYTLSCTSDNGTGLGTATVTLNAEDCSDDIDDDGDGLIDDDDPDCQAGGDLSLDFTANPTSIVPGGSSILSWDSTSAVSCQTSGGPWFTGGISDIRPVDGSESTGSLSATVTYELTCLDSRGASIAQSVTITVGAAGGGAGPTGLSISSANLCSGSWLQPTVSWTYSPQYSYQVQALVAGSGVWSIDSGEVTNSSQSFTFQGGVLQAGTRYEWRVRAKSSSGAAWSDWAEGADIVTAEHRGPIVDFNWQPSSPGIGEIANINDATQVFDGTGSPGGNGHSWNFDGGTQTNASPLNPLVFWDTKGDKTVVLTVTDNDNITCSSSHIIPVSAFQLPIFKEIIPQ